MAPKRPNSKLYLERRFTKLKGTIKIPPKHDLTGSWILSSLINLFISVDMGLSHFISGKRFFFEDRCRGRMTSVVPSLGFHFWQSMVD